MNPPQFMQLVLATSSTCVSSPPDTSAECMDDFATSQPEYLCNVVPSRYALERLELSAVRMEMS